MVDLRRESFSDVYRNVICNLRMTLILILNNNFFKFENGYHGSEIVKNLVSAAEFCALKFEKSKFI